MRVIVTGGAGFVGTMLARRLLAGAVEVGGGEPPPWTSLSSPTSWRPPLTHQPTRLDSRATCLVLAED